MNCIVRNNEEILLLLLLELNRLVHKNKNNVRVRGG
jgi:hypothetical protein